MLGSRTDEDIILHDQATIEYTNSSEGGYTDAWIRLLLHVNWSLTHQQLSCVLELVTMETQSTPSSTGIIRSEHMES